MGGNVARTVIESTEEGNSGGVWVISWYQLVGW